MLMTKIEFYFRNLWSVSLNWFYNFFFNNETISFEKLLSFKIPLLKCTMLFFKY